MPSIQDYVDNLKSDKQKLVDNLTDMGVSAGDDETFTELAPKVLDIACPIVKGEGNFLVQVLDYDGTVLKAERHNRGEKFKLPVAPPEHDNLTFQEWSSTANIVDGEITVENDELVGPLYATKSGYNEFDIVVSPEGLTVQTDMDVVDWGDGTVGGTSYTYTRPGIYTIKTTNLVVSGYYNNLFKTSNAVIYAIGARLKNGTTNIPTNAFHYFANLKYVTIPNTLQSIGTIAVFNCDNLEVLILPNNPNMFPYNVSTNRSEALVKAKKLVYNSPKWCANLVSQYQQYNPTDQSINYSNYIRDLAYSTSFPIIIIDMRKTSFVPTLRSSITFQHRKRLILIKSDLYDDWTNTKYWIDYGNIFIPYDVNGNRVETTKLTLTTSLADTTINVNTTIYRIVGHNYTLPSYSDLTTTIAEANLAWSDGTNTYALGETIEAPDAGTTTFDLIDTTA